MSHDVTAAWVLILARPDLTTLPDALDELERRRAAPSRSRMSRETDPEYQYLVLARPPRDEGDEPPVLSVEGDLASALTECADLGGALVQETRFTGRRVQGVPEYEHVRYINPEGKDL